MLSKGLSRVFSSTQFESINSLVLSLLHSPTLTSIPDHWKNHSLDSMDLCWQSNDSAFQYSVDKQLSSADVVIIALPGTPETAGMFDSARIKGMKRNAILVNVGRGFIVNTDALTKALQNNLLRGAVLDVTDPKPLPENHPLRSMENVVLTPHISGISWGGNTFTRKRILDIFCENLMRDKDNELKRNIIDFSKGY